VKEGDLLYFDTWGGGGWGDPYKRDPAKVAFDVEAGLVTAAGAKANYGVVLKKDLTVDAKATDALRAKLARKRGKTGIFNFGGTIPELKKRCKAETGLEAPKQPEFPRWVRLESKSKGPKGPKGKTRKAA
jgi:N-methylhydantoinase B